MDDKEQKTKKQYIIKVDSVDIYRGIWDDVGAVI